MKKNNRVRKNEEFQDLIHTGHKEHNVSFVLYARKRKETEARIGISLSRKIGNAVQRNKIKRQVRMMCQDLIDFKACENDAILIVRFGYKQFSYAQNQNNLEKLLVKSKMI